MRQRRRDCRPGRCCPKRIPSAWRRRLPAARRCRGYGSRRAPATAARGAHVESRAPARPRSTRPRSRTPLPHFELVLPPLDVLRVTSRIDERRSGHLRAGRRRDAPRADSGALDGAGNVLGAAGGGGGGLRGRGAGGRRRDSAGRRRGGRLRARRLGTLPVATGPGTASERQARRRRRDDRQEANEDDAFTR